MKKPVLAFAAVAMLAAALPSTAQARCHGCGIAAGVIGGVAVGAIIGNALSDHPAYAEPAPPPPPPPSRVYYGDDDDGPVCHIEHRRVWVEDWGWRRERVRVCE